MSLPKTLINYTDVEVTKQFIYKARTARFYVPFLVMYRRAVEKLKHVDKDDVIRYLLYFKSDVRLISLPV